MNLACRCCRSRLPAVPQVCESCRARIARQLATIAGLIATIHTDAAAMVEPTTPDANDPVSRALPAGPVPAIGNSPRTSGGAVEAPIPLNLNLIEAGPAHNPLIDWAHEWWQDGDPPIHNPATWLAAHLDRACDQHGDQVAAFAHDLDRYVGQLRSTAHDNRQLIGHCPTEDCGAELRAHPRDQTADCPNCHTSWPRRHWLWLADTLRPAA